MSQHYIFIKAASHSRYVKKLNLVERKINYGLSQSLKRTKTSPSNLAFF